jgi:hypothetical protein
MYLIPFRYELTTKGSLTQRFHTRAELCTLLALLNSLVLNYYVRNKGSTHVNIFHVYELPIPKLADKLRA